MSAAGEKRIITGTEKEEFIKGVTEGALWEQATLGHKMILKNTKMYVYRSVFTCYLCFLLLTQRRLGF